MAKQELLATIRDRYRASSKMEKSRILDEFSAVTGHHRKHGIRLLGQSGYTEEKPPVVKGRRIYGEAVREAVILVREAADRICGKRLQAALPNLVDAMERHGHLDLDPGVRQRLLDASAATLDRLLKLVRVTAGSRRKRRRRQHMGRHSAGAHLQRLEPASAGLPPNRLCGPLRRDSVRVVHSQRCGHRRLHWVDRGRSAVGQGAIPGGRRSGSYRPTGSFPSPGHRLGQ